MRPKITKYKLQTFCHIKTAAIKNAKNNKKKYHQKHKYMVLQNNY